MHTETDMDTVQSNSDSETSPSNSPGTGHQFLSQIPTTSNTTTSNTSTKSSMSVIDRHAAGTTSVIRQRLNFNDEALWKKFSSRRLQLVEHLSLSSKKASEQDEEIRACAATLMKEFNFPENTLSEFDKLVRLAIQSARRNKKRSEKRLASKALDKSYFVDPPLNPSNGNGGMNINGDMSSRKNNLSPVNNKSNEWQEIKQNYLPSNSTGKFLLVKPIDNKLVNVHTTSDDEENSHDSKRVKLNIPQVDSTDRLKFLSEITLLEEEAERKTYSKNIDIGEDSDTASTLAMHSLLSPLNHPQNGTINNNVNESKEFYFSNIKSKSNTIDLSISDGNINRRVSFTTAPNPSTYTQQAPMLNRINDPRVKVELPSISQLNIRDYDDLFNDFASATSTVLNCIKKSKTCFEFTNSPQRPNIGDTNTSNISLNANGITPNGGNDPTKATGLTSFSNYEGVELLGNSCIMASISMTLERWFDDLSPASTSYIRMKLNGHTILSSVLKSLDKSSLAVTRLSEYVSAQLLKKLIGSCVKDFGFNEIMYPLCDIFHYFIMKEYPLITNRLATVNRKKNPMPSMISLLSGSQRHSINLQSSPGSTPAKNTSSTSLAGSDSEFPKSILDSTILNTSAGQNITHTSNLTQYNPSHNFLPLQPLLPILNPYHSHPDFIQSQTQTQPQTPPAPTAASSPANTGSTSVTLKFNNRELRFAYSSQTSAPPTLLELLTNGKSAFHIMDADRTIQIRDLDSWRVIQSDFELEKLFLKVNPNSTEKVIRLELFFPEGLDINNHGVGGLQSINNIFNRPDLSRSASSNGNKSNNQHTVTTHNLFKFQPLL